MKQRSKEEKFFKNNKGFLDFKMNIEKNRSFVLDKIDAAIDQGKKLLLMVLQQEHLHYFRFTGSIKQKLNIVLTHWNIKLLNFFQALEYKSFEKELQNIEYDLVLVCAWNYKDEIVKKSNELFKKYRANISIPAVEVIKL